MKIEQLRFIEQTTLQTRGPVDSEPDVECETFLRSEKSILCWQSGHERAGYDYNHLFAAWVNGKRAFLLRKIWHALAPYCADGTHESLLTFEEGVKLLVENGVYDFAAPKKAQE